MRLTTPCSSVGDKKMAQKMERVRRQGSRRRVRSVVQVYMSSLPSMWIVVIWGDQGVESMKAIV